MLEERTFRKPGYGTLRVTGDPGDGDFKMKHIDFAEFETESGTIYGPLHKIQAAMILSHPEAVAEICQWSKYQVDQLAITLGLEGT